MQEICTVTALGENALTSISYAKVALQMAETQNGCRKIGLGYSGNNVQCHLMKPQTIQNSLSVRQRVKTLKTARRILVTLVMS